MGVVLRWPGQPVDEPNRHKTVVTVISKISAKPAGKQACLVVIYGIDLGRRHSVDGAAIVLGRSSKADVQIDQESVSRNHARIINTGKSLILRDLGSTNGTFVNDELIDEYVLRDGDFVKIGRTIFKFLTGSNIENAYHEEIYRLTTVDGLTQIFNKRYFVESLERELSRAQRYRRALSLILFDIDHFKLINDRHGHLAGDQVLRQLAAVVKARIRREDVLARYGGEEFAIVLPEIDRANALVFAEKVCRLIEQTQFKFEQNVIPVTVSLGVTENEAESDGAESFIKRADERLYEAKGQGRNRVVG